MSKEIFVAFATQKGGIGKSTVTALAASYLHNVKGYNVAVVDCDDPQHSIHGLREHEMGFPVLSTRLPDSKKFRRDLSEERKSVFRSTIFPMDTALLKGSGIREFSEEISDIIRPQ